MELLGHEAQVEVCFRLFGHSANLDSRKAHGLHRMYHRLRKLFWTQTMEFLCDMGHVESCFGVFGNSASVGARYVHGLRQTYHRLINRFGRTRWYS
jgi:hypothetical protein